MKTETGVNSRNQADIETEENLGRDGTSMRGQNWLDCLHHEDEVHK
jgi:hypothetical protein